MRRCLFLGVLGGAAVAVPLVARTQQNAKPLIGFLSSASPGPSAPIVAAFREGLRDAGYIDGQNVAIEYRWAEGRYDWLPALADDLVRAKVKVIEASGFPASRAAKNATSSVPIVFSGGADPVAAGLVTSLARPGGNITGISDVGVELTPKRLEFLSELVPQAMAMALLINPNNPNAERIVSDAEGAARAVGVKLHIVKATAEGEFDAIFAALIQLNARALIVANDPLFINRHKQFVVVASRYGIPVMYAWREFVLAGGLISYGPSLTATLRQAGIYVGRILKGEKPAELPVQQLSKFELVVNLNTAKTLGLIVPQSILARADEVIE